MAVQPRRRLIWVVAMLCLLPACASDLRADAPRVAYDRDVRPILAEHCFACHGPDAAARQADLRLDLRADAIAAGAIVPGKPQESLLVRRVYATTKEEVMPPRSTH